MGALMTSFEVIKHDQMVMLRATSGNVAMVTLLRSIDSEKLVVTTLAQDAVMSRKL